MLLEQRVVRACLIEYNDFADLIFYSQAMIRLRLYSEYHIIIAMAHSSQLVLLTILT